MKIDPKNHEAKSCELKMKASMGKSGAHQKVDMKQSGSHGNEAVGAGSNGKKGFLDQLKELLNKKI